MCHGMNKLNFLTTIIQGLRKLPLKKSDIFFGGAIQKRNSIRMDAVLFCLRSPNAEPPPSRPCGSDGIAPHQTNDLAHISARSGGYKSHLRNQKILTHMSEDFFIILCFSLLLAPIFLRAESAMILRTFSSFSFNKIGEVGNQLTRKINMSIY